MQQIVCAAQRKCALQLCDSRRPTREVLRKCHTQHEHTRQCWRANPRAVPSTHGAQRERERAEHFMRASSPTVEAIMLKVREGDVGTANLWASIGHNAIRNDPPEDALLLV